MAATPRTSLTHPLRMDTVPVQGTSGRIGMTICPGKKGASNYGPPWDRDLTLDLQRVSAWRPDLVVTLMEQRELSALGVGDLGPRLQRLGLSWLHLPIQDLQAPDVSFVELWRRHGPTVRGLLRGGGLVLLHCRGGLGRTGTVAAQLLVEFGSRPADALTAVRAARRGTVETSAQERYVLGLRPLE